MVWNELRIALILTCRDLEITDAYADFDAQRQKEMSTLERLKMYLFGEPLQTLDGDTVYQTDTGGLQPVDDYACYVKWIEKS